LHIFINKNLIKEEEEEEEEEDPNPLRQNKVMI
jgi:hypothetical protein